MLFLCCIFVVICAGKKLAYGVHIALWYVMFVSLEYYVVNIVLAVFMFSGQMMCLRNQPLCLW